MEQKQEMPAEATDPRNERPLVHINVDVKNFPVIRVLNRLTKIIIPGVENCALVNEMARLQ